MWGLCSRAAMSLQETVFLIRPGLENGRPSLFSSLFLLRSAATASSQDHLQGSLSDRCQSQRGHETPPTERAALQLPHAILGGLPQPRRRDTEGREGGDAGVPSANGGRGPGTVTAAPAWGRDAGRAAPASSRRRAPGAARQPRPPGSAALPWCPRRPGSPGGSRRTGRGS